MEAELVRLFPDAPPLFAPRASQRGFTLVELSVVVIIISVFAALAIPQVTKQLRDRRVQETAVRVLQAFQQARERAIGRGGAVLVRYDLGAGGQGRLQIFEGRVGSADSKEKCAFMPNPSCTGVNWADTGATGEAFAVSSWDVSTDSGLDRVFVEMFKDPDTDSGASTTFADLCFTPLGRTFVRYQASDTLTPLAEIPLAKVFRSVGAIDANRIGLTRRVVILPSGAARLEAELE